MNCSVNDFFKVPLCPVSADTRSHFKECNGYFLFILLFRLISDIPNVTFPLFIFIEGSHNLLAKENKRIPFCKSLNLVLYFFIAYKDK